MDNRKPCPDWISILVIMFLGVTALLLSAGIIYLADVGKTPDAAIFTLAGTAIGGLGSMLTNTHRTSGQRTSDSEPVAVTTAPGDSVSVTEAEPEPKEDMSHDRE